MRLRTLFSIALISGFVAATGAQAQQEDSTAAQEKAFLVRMKSDLRNLVTAQEAYYADHSAYSIDVDQLKFRPSEGVTVRLTATQNNAWAAEARSSDLPNVSCSVFINLKAEYRPKAGPNQREATEGAPACDVITPKP